MLEKEIEKRVCEHAKEMKILSYKFVSPGHIGVPDRIFITPKGYTFFIEFKRNGGKTTPMQDREIARIRATGVQVHIVDDVGQGVGFINGVMEFECAR